MPALLVASAIILASNFGGTEGGTPRVAAIFRRIESRDPPSHRASAIEPSAAVPASGGSADDSLAAGNRGAPHANTRITVKAVGDAQLNFFMSVLLPGHIKLSYSKDPRAHLNSSHAWHERDSTKCKQLVMIVSSLTMNLSRRRVSLAELVASFANSPNTLQNLKIFFLDDVLSHLHMGRIQHAYRARKANDHASSCTTLSSRVPSIDLGTLPIPKHGWTSALSKTRNRFSAMLTSFSALPGERQSRTTKASSEMSSVQFFSNDAKCYNPSSS
jgi:hypothetical protein